jgi:hypothetical protein
MQPYFFPYIGYFQLIAAVDRFVILDDVNFIKRGWINRNRILINASPCWLSIPVTNISQFRKIAEHTCCDIPWRQKMLRSIEMAYRRTPFFAEAYAVIAPILANRQNDLATYLADAIVALARALAITADIVTTSRNYANGDLHGQERIIDICRQEGASHYINAEGGQDLYAESAFAAADISLSFVAAAVEPYPQLSPAFIGRLSIIDMLMNIGIQGTKAQLTSFRLLPGCSDSRQ